LAGIIERSEIISDATALQLRKKKKNKENRIRVATTKKEKK
jgi:metal-responsive CopG/Arc/MetJ family transcriptional regulator